MGGRCRGASSHAPEARRAMFWLPHILDHRSDSWRGMWNKRPTLDLVLEYCFAGTMVAAARSVDASGGGGANGEGDGGNVCTAVAGFVHNPLRESALKAAITLLR